MGEQVERYVENYVVNKNTMALLPVILGEKRIVTRVVEVEDSFLCFKSRLILSNEVAASTDLVFRQKRRYKRVNTYYAQSTHCDQPDRSTLLFPTYSYSRKECAWLSHFHIENNKELADGNLIIRFINGLAVKLEISKSSFENQQNRTAKLRTEYEDRKDKQRGLHFKQVDKEYISTLKPAYEKAYLVKEEDEKE